MIVLNSGRKQELFNDTQSSQRKEIIKPVFIAESSVMKNIHNKIKNLAHAKSNLLILGDEGTGRQSTAYEVFYQNKYPQSEREFFIIDCQGMAPHLIEQKLFGDKYSKSYTSLLSSNENNTIYLKNINFLNLNLQKKIYSYLTKEKTYNRPRLISSSNELISKKIQSKKFLQELFNILSEDLIILPLLKERQKDISHLISFFNKKNHFKGFFDSEALEFLQSYSWYGNIIELKDMCLKLSILYHEKDIISKKDLSHIIRDLSAEAVDIKYNPNLTLNNIMNLYIEKSLEHFGCKKSAARALGISIKTLYNKLKIGVVSERQRSSIKTDYFKRRGWRKA